MEKYSQYIELKGKEMLLKEKDFGLSEQQFGLKQKQDEHGLRRDRERAELEDRSAKRQRFDASTDDGVTFRTLLAKVAEGSSNAKAFEEEARQLSLGLEVHRASNSMSQEITSLFTTMQRQQISSPSSLQRVLLLAQKELLETYAAISTQHLQQPLTLVTCMTAIDMDSSDAVESIDHLREGERPDGGRIRVGKPNV